MSGLPLGLGGNLIAEALALRDVDLHEPTLVDSQLNGTKTQCVECIEHSLHGLRQGGGYRVTSAYIIRFYHKHPM